MQIKPARVIIGMIFLGCVLFEQAYAQQVKHIRIENTIDPGSIVDTYTQAGNWTILHSGGTSYTCATGTANKYSISGSPTFDSPDQDSDLVRFHNATITALNDVCGHISFWAKFHPDPSGTVDLDLSSYGQIKDTIAPYSTSGSWVHISGWLQHYSNGSLPGLADGITGNWEHIGTTNGPPGSPSPQDKHGSTTGNVSFSLTTDENPDRPGIVNDRIMKGELWFFLKKDHRLILNSNTGVTVITAAGGGGGGGGLCDYFDCEIFDNVKELLDQSVDARLERLEKHQKLPPFPRPEPVPNPLEERHMPPEP